MSKSNETAQNYMSVARFAGKNGNVSVFSGLAPSVLYRLAALPDEKAATLTPDTLLTDPRTGRQTALSQMSARSLDRALDALEGKTVPKGIVDRCLKTTCPRCDRSLARHCVEMASLGYARLQEEMSRASQ